MADSKATSTDDDGASFYKFNYATLPDELCQVDVPVEKWLATTTTVGPSGFPNNSLNKLYPVDQDVEYERLVGISLYMIGNVFPFIFPIFLIWSYFSVLGQYATCVLLIYVTILYVIENYYFIPKFKIKYNRTKEDFAKDTIKKNQYIITERNTCKYLSASYIWPKSCHRPALESKPVIFCVIPHSVVPYGIVSYPLWSKLWNDKLCSWTTVPVVLQLPIVGYFMKRLGYIPAKSKNIMEALTKKERNVGLILDGIAGMFQQHSDEEVAQIQSRKGIIKIALRAGVKIIPVYGFGHTSCYWVAVDPFGILKYLSVALDTALTPFFGRYGWFLGPPKRIPVTMCLGEPIDCPQIDEPTKEDILTYHQKMLNSFENVFNQHKDAYGWGHKKIKFV